MKNIYDILKSVGVEIPEDKKEEFDKSVHENYKTIKEVEGIEGKLSKAEQERDTYKTKYETDIAQRDGDLEDLKKKLEDAGTDKTKIEELTAQLGTLQTSYETAKTDYEKQLAKQKKEFLVKENVNSLKFSSNSAKKAFLADVLAKDLPVENDTLLGFQDFVDAYKEQDAGAFIADDTPGGDNPGKPKPQFIGKSNNLDNPGNGKGNEGSSGEDNNDLPIIW